MQTLGPSTVPGDFNGISKDGTIQARLAPNRDPTSKRDNMGS
jgi:hypothetical protein